MAVHCLLISNQTSSFEAKTIPFMRMDISAQIFSMMLTSGLRLAWGAPQVSQEMAPCTLR
eukprot:TRINITY_DN3058_c1_g7_i1.p4 TRINITY_DN3058_c1_g7~~TRINITY_DN3058_c1_g7_i1.p4  ORF type:complete len:60 (+),score=12.55 TRINITY_DN3058_c1_g7_i1:212-391(+)